MIPRHRRIGIAVSAIAISAFLMHGAVSSSLVLRGDELVVRGQTGRAIAMYRRALAWDATNETAADRLAFDETVSHRPPLVADAVVVSTRYLRRERKSVTLLLDRALAEQILRRYTAAERDYATAAQLTPSARTLTFAGFAALHAGDRGRARALFLDAVRLDHHFEPALHGIAQS